LSVVGELGAVGLGVWPLLVRAGCKVGGGGRPGEGGGGGVRGLGFWRVQAGRGRGS